MEAIRVVLADDHALFREGTRGLLERDGKIAVVGEAADGEESIAVIDRELPDVAIVDIEMPGVNGIEVTRRVKDAHPQVCVLALTVHDEAPYVVAVLEAGAAGYLLKDVDSREVIHAVRALFAGESVLHPAVTRHVLEHFQNPGGPPAHQTPAALSERDLHILRQAARGLTNSAIAESLGVSTRTVQQRLTHVFGLLGVGSRTEAVVAALRTGLFDLDEVGR